MTEDSRGLSIRRGRKCCVHTDRRWPWSLDWYISLPWQRSYPVSHEFVGRVELHARSSFSSLTTHRRRQAWHRAGRPLDGEATDCRPLGVYSPRLRRSSITSFFWRRRLATEYAGHGSWESLEGPRPSIYLNVSLPACLSRPTQTDDRVRVLALSGHRLATSALGSMNVASASAVTEARTRM